MIAAKEHSSRAYWGDAGTLVLDEEFRDLAPRVAADEQPLVEARLRRDGCDETRVVWPQRTQTVLLVGYEWVPTLKRYHIPFRIVDRSFAARDEAEPVAKMGTGSLYLRCLS